MSASRIFGRLEAQSHTEQEEASHGCLREGRRLRAVGALALSGEVGQPVRTTLGITSLGIPSLPLHLHRVAADSAMDLAGLLLDEEGTFSLADFQDFTVRAQPACSLLLAVVTPQRSPPYPSGMGTLFLVMPWIGRLLRAMPTRRPMLLGPEGKASGYKGTASD